jgi:hypothetical protein
MSVAYDYEARRQWGSVWTPEMDAILAEQWGTRSTALIAQAITEAHIPVTKNAVISRAHRIKLEKLNNNAAQERKPRRRTHPVRTTRVRISRPIPQPFSGSLDIPFLEIGPNQCREIVGVGVALCCGQPQTVASSYCHHHHAINHWVRP